MKMGQCNRVHLGSLPVKFGGNQRKKVQKYNKKIMAKTIVFTMVMVKPNNIGKNNSLHYGNGEA